MGDKLSDAANAVKKNVNKAYEATADKVSSAKDAVVDKASEAKDAITGKAADARDAVEDKARDAKHAVSNAADDVYVLCVVCVTVFGVGTVGAMPIATPPVTLFSSTTHLNHPPQPPPSQARSRLLCSRRGQGSTG